MSPSPCDADALHRLRARERLEVGRLEHFGEVDELHAEPRVGLVGAEPLHRVEPRHPRDDFGRLVGSRGARRGEHRERHGLEHVFLIGEAHLDVELHELELAVGAQVFVAEAARDLEVAIEPADHQQLLEQLRALGQRVERAGPQPRRHDEVARAFRRGRDEHRRLDLDEVLRAHRLAHRAVHVGAHPQVALHRRAAQIEVAMAQAQHFVDVGAIVERERRRVGLVEDLDRRRADLDRAGGKIGVDGAVGTGPHRALARSTHSLRTRCAASQPA